MYRSILIPIPPTEKNGKWRHLEILSVHTQKREDRIMRVYSQDIKEKREFTFQCDVLKYSKHEPTTNKYLYERYYKAANGEFRLLGYELVIPVRHKNPDGSIVECYPSSEQFGSKGWFFPKSTTEDVLVMALKCEGNPFVKENAKK